ncbi:adenosylmethionine decarboxylase [Sphingomonas sp.]|uniref:adenosylmethionine decarboxylase n=1 Tax=Sphingomonas sp. TaxID=28214 RepID=UPI002BBF31F0|nr:adenosylmethionine decarboxylase [Sphingomonas sp.]HTG37967.1 adenosylmethionine decarboxylase [Sphingomonas sp.]
MTPPPYDGVHLIADLTGCTGLDDVALIERALRAAASAAGATLIELRLHAFGPGQGVTGMALLAESHISIHSWPEHGYAAVDIFVCGRRCDPHAALTTLADMLHGSAQHIRSIKRGFGLDQSAPTNWR